MCPDVTELNAYLDKELSIFQVKDFEKHLQECPSCAEKYKNLQRLQQMFSKKLEVNVELDTSLERFERKRYYAEQARLSRPSIVEVAQTFLPLAAAVGLFILPSFLLNKSIDEEEALALQPLATISVQSVSSTQKRNYEEQFGKTSAYFELTLPSQLSLPQLSEDNFSEASSKN